MYSGRDTFHQKPSEEANHPDARGIEEMGKSGNQPATKSSCYDINESRSSTKPSEEATLSDARGIERIDKCPSHGTTADNEPFALTDTELWNFMSDHLDESPMPHSLRQCNSTAAKLSGASPPIKRPRFRRSQYQPIEPEGNNLRHSFHRKYDEATMTETEKRTSRAERDRYKNMLYDRLEQYLEEVKEENEFKELVAILWSDTDEDNEEEFDLIKAIFGDSDNESEKDSDDEEETNPARASCEDSEFEDQDSSSDDGGDCESYARGCSERVRSIKKSSRETPSSSTASSREAPSSSTRSARDSDQHSGWVERSVQTWKEALRAAKSIKARTRILIDTPNLINDTDSEVESDVSIDIICLVCRRYKHYAHNCHQRAEAIDSLRASPTKDTLFLCEGRTDLLTLDKVVKSCPLREHDGVIAFAADHKEKSISTSMRPTRKVGPIMDRQLLGEGPNINYQSPTETKSRSNSDLFCDTDFGEESDVYADMECAACHEYCHCECEYSQKAKGNNNPSVSQNKDVSLLCKSSSINTTDLYQQSVRRNVNMHELQTRKPLRKLGPTRDQLPHSECDGKIRSSLTPDNNDVFIISPRIRDGKLMNYKGSTRDQLVTQSEVPSTDANVESVIQTDLDNVDVEDYYFHEILCPHHSNSVHHCNVIPDIEITSFIDVDDDIVDSLSPPVEDDSATVRRRSVCDQGVNVRPTPQMRLNDDDVVNTSSVENSDEDCRLSLWKDLCITINDVCSNRPLRLFISDRIHGETPGQGVQVATSAYHDDRTVECLTDGNSSNTNKTALAHASNNITDFEYLDQNQPLDETPYASGRHMGAQAEQEPGYNERNSVDGNTIPPFVQLPRELKRPDPSDRCGLSSLGNDAEQVVSERPRLPTVNELLQSSADIEYAGMSPPTMHKVFAEEDFTNINHGLYESDNADSDDGEAKCDPKSYHKSSYEAIQLSIKVARKASPINDISLPVKDASYLESWVRILSNDQDEKYVRHTAQSQTSKLAIDVETAVHTGNSNPIDESVASQCVGNLFETKEITMPTENTEAAATIGTGLFLIDHVEREIANRSLPEADWVAIADSLGDVYSCVYEHNDASYITQNYCEDESDPYVDRDRIHASHASVNEVMSHQGVHYEQDPVCVEDGLSSDGRYDYPISYNQHQVQTDRPVHLQRVRHEQANVRVEDELSSGGIYDYPISYKQHLVQTDRSVRPRGVSPHRDANDSRMRYDGGHLVFKNITKSDRKSCSAVVINSPHLEKNSQSSFSISVSAYCKRVTDVNERYPRKATRLITYVPHGKDIVSNLKLFASNDLMHGRCNLSTSKSVQSNIAACKTGTDMRRFKPTDVHMMSSNELELVVSDDSRCYIYITDNFSSCQGRDVSVQRSLKRIKLTTNVYGKGSAGHCASRIRIHRNTKDGDDANPHIGNTCHDPNEVVSGKRLRDPARYTYRDGQLNDQYRSTDGDDIILRGVLNIPCLRVAKD